MNSVLSARCSCGSVQLQSGRQPFLQLTCHCRQCREASGQPFTNLVFLKLSETEVSGATTERHFVADSGARTTRAHCAACGDMMFDRSEGFPAMIGVVAERIDPPFSFSPRCHVWLEAQVEPPPVVDGVARYERGLP